MATINKIFNFLNLSERALKIYETIVENGIISASSLARESEIPRSTVYLEIDRLLSHALISSTGSVKKRKFVAENPNNFIKILENKTSEINSLLSPTMELVKGLQEKVASNSWFGRIPKIKFFNGKEGLKKVLTTTNQAKSKEILGIVRSFDIYESLGEEYMKNLITERIKKKIHTKNIWPAGKIPKAMDQHKEQLREIVFSKEQENIPSTIVVFDNKVILITSTKELFCVEIESRDLAQTFRVLFGILWDREKTKQ